LSGLVLIIIAFLFITNLVFIAIAITDLLQRENVKYLPKTVWIIVIALVFFSSIIYLLIGRGEEPNRAIK